MAKPYETLVFIGRFQPFHLGHQTIIEQALENANRVLVLVGSANAARSFRNPFTYEERHDMIVSSSVERNRLYTAPLDDFTYRDSEWIKQVQETVSGFGPNRPGKTGLIGRSKDNSSYYLKLFPQWDSIAGDVHPDYGVINATDIREEFFVGKNFAVNRQYPVSGFTQDFLCDFAIANDDYQKVCFEKAKCAEYQDKWKGSPHIPSFNTVDSIVVCSGHVLTIRRKDFPGMGLRALPGGFINPKETLLDAALRELNEETHLRVHPTELKSALRASRTFDDPYRDPRGRFITHGHLFDLGNRIKLPHVKAGDDARDAEWVPLANLKAKEFFSDHYHIIKAMTAGL